VPPIIDRPSDQGHEQVLELAAGQRDHAWCRGMLGTLDERDDHQEGVGEHGRVTHRYQERQQRT
jgi:hypothetical protein